MLHLAMCLAAHDSIRQEPLQDPLGPSDVIIDTRTLAMLGADNQKDSRNVHAGAGI